MSTQSSCTFVSSGADGDGSDEMSSMWPRKTGCQAAATGSYTCNMI